VKSVRIYEEFLLLLCMVFVKVIC